MAYGFTFYEVLDNTSLAWSTIGAVSGDLIVLFFANDGGDNQTTPGDLTRIDSNDGSTMEGGCYYRICTGSETGNLITDESTFGITGGGGEAYTSHVYKIPTGQWHGTTPPEGTTARGDTGTIDPPSHTASWGSETLNIWFVAAARDDTDGIADLTTIYDPQFTYSAPPAGGQVELASSYRPATAAAENPGTANQTGTGEEWKAWTVAVRPAANIVNPPWPRPRVPSKTISGR